MSVTRQRLEVADRNKAGALDRLIAGACAGDAAAPDFGGELLLSAGGGPSLLMSVHPVAPAMAGGINTRCAASIIMRAIGADGPPGMAARLSSLFALSAREAELAMLLLEGCSLQEAAERRGVRITTARSQLAGLFRKTGTTRQGQLIALLARLG